MSFPNSDTLELAITDPRSPHFQKAMQELHNQQMTKKSDTRIIDEIIIDILNDEKLQDEQLVEKQLKLSKEASKKYLADIAEQQEKHHMEILQQQMHLDLHAPMNQLRIQLDALTEERQAINLQLVELTKRQEKNHAAWIEQAKQVENDVMAEVKNPVVAKAVAKAIASDPKRILDQRSDIVVMATENPKTAEQIADVMALKKSLVGVFAGLQVQGKLNPSNKKELESGINKSRERRKELMHEHLRLQMEKQSLTTQQEVIDKTMHAIQHKFDQTNAHKL